MKHNSHPVLFLLVILFFTLVANAGILSALSKVGKTAKIVKVVTVAEGATILFSKLGKNKRTRALYIGEDVSGNLKIYSPDNKSFIFNEQSASLSKFIDNVKSQLYISNKNIKFNDIDIYIPDVVFFKNKKHFDKLSSINDVYIYTEQGLIKTKVVKTKGEEYRVLNYKDSVLINVKSANELTNIFWSFSQKVYTSDIKIISLFDEFDILTHSSLSRVARERHISSGNINKTNLKEIIEKQKGKSVFIIGHVENKSFVIRGADNRVKSTYKIRAIEKIGRENNIPIVLLGCKTAVNIKNISGYLRNIHDLEVFDSLSKALTSKNYGEFFQSFGSVDTPFMLQAAIADDISLNIKAIKLMKKQEKIGQYVTLSQIRITTPSIFYLKEMEQRIIWFLPSWVHNAYLVAYFFSIFTFLSGWRLIKEKWIVSEYIVGQKVKSIREKVLRFLTYLVMLPFYTIFRYVSLPFTVAYDLLKIIYYSLVILYNYTLISISFLLRLYEKLKS